MMTKINLLTKNLFLSLLIFGIFIGSWLFIQNKTQQRQVIAPITKHKPDGFSSQITYKDIDDAGKIKNELSTTEVMHFPKINQEEGDNTQLQKPKFTVYQDQQDQTLAKNPSSSPFQMSYNTATTPWIIKAQHAETLQGGKVVKLYGNVSIDKAGDNKNPEKHIRTQSLTFYPKENRVQTKSHVVLQQPDATIQAVGVTADLNKDVVYFLSNTEIVYKPLNPKDSTYGAEKLFKTNRLIFHPKVNQVETKDPIVLEQAGMRISANGLKADFNKETVTFLSNTKIIYIPNADKIKKE